MIKAVIFDYGGVVIPLPNTRSHICQKLNLDRKVFDESVESVLPMLRLGQINETEFWSQYCRLISIPLPEDYQNLWSANLKAEFSLYWPIVHLLVSLKKAKYKLAVLSNTIPSHLLVGRFYDGYQWFDHEIQSCEVGLAKPDPAIYELCLDMLQLKPQQCLFIDDSSINLKPAKQLGINCLLAKNPAQVVTDVIKLLKLSSSDQS